MAFSTAMDRRKNNLLIRVWQFLHTPSCLLMWKQLSTFSKVLRIIIMAKLTIALRRVAFLFRSPLHLHKTLNALKLILIGAWLISPFWDTFGASPAFSEMRRVAPEWAWGGFSVLIGVMYFAALYTGNYKAQRASLFVSLFFWITFSYSLARGALRRPLAEQRQACAGSFLISWGSADASDPLPCTSAMCPGVGKS